MKYSINFLPEKCKGNADEGNVRMLVQWSDGGRCSIFIGRKVILEKWSREAQRCKPNTTHGKYSSTKINKDIQRYEDAANRVMQEYDLPPTKEEVKQAVLNLLGLSTKKSGKRVLKADYTEFMLEQARLKSWSMNTTLAFRGDWKILHEMNGRDLTYDDILTEAAQNKILTWLQDVRQYKSLTVREYIKHINWFLRWAERKGYIDKAPNVRPDIKTAPKKVIYLTQQELMTIYNADIENEKKRRTRDFFCFCCFTGLRHSDAYALRTSDIRNNAISIVSKKDTDNLVIELNKYSKALLERVELTDEEKAEGYALPHLPTEYANYYLHLIAKACGIKDKITIVSFKGGKRVEEEKEKWELITTHTGRKTFICTALSKGVSPTIVMRWTGHSNYSAMRPYIDIVDSAKREAMNVFNEL